MYSSVADVETVPMRTMKAARALDMIDHHWNLDLPIGNINM